MTNRKDKKEFGSILRQARVMGPLTLRELATMSGVSSSHLGRIERGQRFPSGSVLRKLAKPLGFEEDVLFTLAGYLSPQSSSESQEPSRGQLDPYVAGLLSQEPVEVQHTVIGILSILKSMAQAKTELPEFRDYARRKYPNVDGDIITMIEDVLEHPQG